MAWLALRRHCGSLLLLSGLTIVLCIALLITGQQVHHLYDQVGLHACLRVHTDVDSCTIATDRFLLSPSSFSSWRVTFPFFYALPFLFGMLVGAPLIAREFEQRTQEFTWAQGVTRRHWFWTQFGTLLLVLLVLMGLLSLVVAWWNEPYAALDGSLLQPTYDFLGILPLGFSIFGFTLGVAAGALFRRVLPAVAAMFLYLPIWQGLDTFARGYLLQPITAYFPMAGTPPDLSRQDWVLSHGYVDPSGAQSVTLTAPQQCASQFNPGQSNSINTLTQCLASHGFRQYLTYQPASHFWLLQATETAILMALALLLVVFTHWRLHRRAG